jgi:DNA-binding transcriptional ArsR family regulator
VSSFTALADPTRRSIVELLAEGELCAGEVVDRFAITASAVSQHLKVLRDARLVRVRVDAQRRIYRLDPAGIQEIEAWLIHIKRFWNKRLDELERQLRKPQSQRRRKND